MPAERYRKLATKLHAEASNEESPELKVELEHLARCYALLAKQADRNSQTDVNIGHGG
jgi:hypothetical protein